ncbi:MAG TPA: D-Ala-D-Ala carboxypeptidase family metallohydrolase, partial [Bacillota bacterium]|nr:D-Ala-D-Ala carboxypeptidase family metallohydrolase [Bacillota bacterium]
NDQLTSNFSLSEFASKDGSSIPEKYLSNIQELARNLQILRNAIGNRAIVINSGYRSPRHNNSVGGAKGSQHLLGTAADITVEGMKPKDVKNLIEQLIAAGQMKQGGLGLYPTFIHYDIRGNKKRW